VRYFTDIDPPMPTAEQMEADNRRERESYALWMFDDVYEERALLVRDARKDAMVRQWPELFRG
jgi:hypothetical protein